MPKKPSNTRVLGCPECGNPYEAYPPHDLHTRASLIESTETDSDMKMKIIHDYSRACQKSD